MQCNDWKQKPHERNKHTIIRIRKIHRKTNEWLKETEGIGRIKCLIYDEVVQTRIKYLHISIIHPWQRWLKLPALQPCSVLHFTLPCYMHLYIIIIIGLWLGAFVRWLSFQFDGMWNAYQSILFCYSFPKLYEFNCNCNCDCDCILFQSYSFVK